MRTSNLPFREERPLLETSHLPSPLRFPASRLPSQKRFLQRPQVEKRVQSIFYVLWGPRPSVEVPPGPWSIWRQRAWEVLRLWVTPRKGQRVPQKDHQAAITTPIILRTTGAWPLGPQQLNHRHLGVSPGFHH